MSLPVAYSLDEVAERLAPRASVVTLGVFDGVHRGHSRIIEEVIERKASDQLEGAYLITFDPHPVLVTRSRKTPPILSTIEERLELFSRFPLDGVFVVTFDEVTARLRYREFIERYLVGAMDVRHLVLGYDHYFGYKREGSPERVREEGARRGFGVSVVPPVEFESSVVSSTFIRAALQAGDIDEANGLLGHPYLVSGEVVVGQGRGRGFGFPTANVEVSHALKLWPPQGVYAVNIQLSGEWLPGMMNVGTAPTVRGAAPGIEVHIFDFDRDIYGERVLVSCEAYLRGERRFPSEEALILQLKEDQKAARGLLSG
jgi:riboflavin kinase/FMN adenylyltransferase